MTRKLAVGALVLILVPLASAGETKKKVDLGPALNEAQCLVAKSKLDAVGLLAAEHLQNIPDDGEAVCAWVKRAEAIRALDAQARRLWYRGCLRKVEPAPGPSPFAELLAGC